MNIGTGEPDCNFIQNHGIESGISGGECRDRELTNSKLSEKLQSGQVEFTDDELYEMGVSLGWDQADRWIKAGDYYYTPDGNYQKHAHSPKDGNYKKYAHRPSNPGLSFRAAAERPTLSIPVLGSREGSAPWVADYMKGQFCKWDALKVNGIPYCGWGLDYYGGHWQRETISGKPGDRRRRKTLNLDDPRAHLLRKSNEYKPIGNYILMRDGVYKVWVFGPTGGPKGEVPMDGKIEWTSMKPEPREARPCGNLDPWCTGVPPDVKAKLMPHATNPRRTGATYIDMGTPMDSVYRKSQAYRSDAPVAWEVCWPYPELAARWERAAVRHVRTEKQQHAIEWKRKAWYAWGKRRCSFDGSDDERHPNLERRFKCEYQCEKNCETGEELLPPPNGDRHKWFKGPW